MIDLWTRSDNSGRTLSSSLPPHNPQESCPFILVVFPDKTANHGRVPGRKIKFYNINALISMVDTRQIINATFIVQINEILCIILILKYINFLDKEPDVQ